MLLIYVLVSNVDRQSYIAPCDSMFFVQHVGDGDRGDLFKHVN